MGTDNKHNTSDVFSDARLQALLDAMGKGNALNVAEAFTHLRGALKVLDDIRDDVEQLTTSAAVDGRHQYCGSCHEKHDVHHEIERASMMAMVTVRTTAVLLDRWLSDLPVAAREVIDSTSDALIEECSRDADDDDAASDAHAFASNTGNGHVH